MKKILLAFDNIHFSEGAFEFARRLNELQPILLTGIFMPQARLANLWSYATSISLASVPQIENVEDSDIQLNIQRFEKLCIRNNINFRVHKDFYNLVLPELKNESLFADVLILGSEIFYETMDTQVPNDFLQEAFHHAKCPVIVVPENFEFPEINILAYDGSDDAVFAIKQFAYLFPELANRETLLVFASEDSDKDFPDKIQLEELVARHFSNLILMKLDVNPKKYFSSWILEKKSAMLISGSYGRSGLSQLFKKSFVKEVIAAHKLPVFIAHS
ncbi:MAG: hypothetical protein ABIW38_09475 [Ferruginibacter sp.]